MPPRNDRETLIQILDHAREARDLTRGKSDEDIVRDRVLSLALVRLLEIIGEAAGRVSNDFQRRHAEIPWPQLISLRNRLIHGYDAVDMGIVWKISQTDLPNLIRSIEQLLGTTFGADEPPSIE